MNRRGFLVSLLAFCAAPLAILRRAPVAQSRAVMQHDLDLMVSDELSRAGSEQWLQWTNSMTEYEPAERKALMDAMRKAVKKHEFVMARESVQAQAKFWSVSL